MPVAVAVVALVVAAVVVVVLQLPSSRKIGLKVLRCVLAAMGDAHGPRQREGINKRSLFESRHVGVLEFEGRAVLEFSM